MMRFSVFFLAAVIFSLTVQASAKCYDTLVNERISKGDQTPLGDDEMFTSCPKLNFDFLSLCENRLDAYFISKILYSQQIVAPTDEARALMAQAMARLEVEKADIDANSCPDKAGQ